MKCLFGPCENEAKKLYCSRLCKSRYHNAKNRGEDPKDPLLSIPGEDDDYECELHKLNCSNCQFGQRNKEAINEWICSKGLFLKCKPFNVFPPKLWREKDE